MLYYTWYIAHFSAFFSLWFYLRLVQYRKKALICFSIKQARLRINFDTCTFDMHCFFDDFWLTTWFCKWSCEKWINIVTFDMHCFSMIFDLKCDSANEVVKNGCKFNSCNGWIEISIQYDDSTRLDTFNILI